jgi:hypothetical protein
MTVDAALPAFRQGDAPLGRCDASPKGRCACRRTAKIIKKNRFSKIARRLAWKQPFYNESVAAHELRRTLYQMAGNILIKFTAIFI